MNKSAEIRVFDTPKRATVEELLELKQKSLKFGRLLEIAVEGLKGKKLN